MIDEPQARELAKAAFNAVEVVLGEATELETGWFFPCIAKNSNIRVGVITNKETGRVLPLFAGSPMANNPTLYDRGYHFDEYDLVILSVEDLDETVRTLLELHETTPGRVLPLRASLAGRPGTHRGRGPRAASVVAGSLHRPLPLLSR